MKKEKEMGDNGKRLTRGGGTKDGTQTEKEEKLKDDKQQKLTDKWGKKVTFEESRMVKLEKEMEEFKKSVTEEVRKLRLEKVEIVKTKIELENELAGFKETIGKLENRIEFLENREKEREEMSVRKGDSEVGEGFETESGEGDSSSRKSITSTYSRLSVASKYSISDREMKMLKWVASEKDRKDRENNVVIKGWKVGTGNLIEEVRKFFEEKLEFRGEIDAVWTSGGVIVVRLDKVCKIEVMKRKSKLAGSRIFIENDLSYEERKKQETINRWVKEKKEIGIKVRAGLGKIRYEDIWYKWDDRERIVDDWEKMKERLERMRENDRRREMQENLI